MSVATDDRLMTADEVAELLGNGFTAAWVLDQARKGRIPVVKLGRYRRFRRSSIQRMIEDLEEGGS